VLSIHHLTRPQASQPGIFALVRSIEDRLMGHDQDMQRRQVRPARYRMMARSGLGPARDLRGVTWPGPQKAGMIR